MLIMADNKHIELRQAIRGFHYCRKYWWPDIDEKLICIHEQENVFDMFVIKTSLEDGRAVGHLPREI